MRQATPASVELQVHGVLLLLPVEKQNVLLFGIKKTI